MAHIRFWKRIKIFPGVYLNIGKKGISISFGPKGVKYTVGTKGTRFSAGIPGTGIYYVNQKNKKVRKEQEEEPENLDIEELKKRLKEK